MMPATTFDCDKRARSCKQQPTFFINVDQPHWQLQGAKRQREDWSQGHNANSGNATIISYCHITRSNDNNRWMQRKIKQTPMQQSNFHVVVCGMRRWPYCTTWWPAAQVCWGWVQGVCQRQIVHCQRRVCHKRQIHWVRQRGRVRCQGQVWWVLAFMPLLARAYFCCITRSDNIKKKPVVPRVCKLLALRWRRGLYFLCRIVMSKRQWYNVFIVLRGSKQWPCGIVREQASVHCIARANKDNIQPSGGCKVHLQWYGDDGPPRNNQSFICCRAQEATTLSISLCRIATREQQQLNFLHQLQGNKQRQLNG